MPKIILIAHNIRSTHNIGSLLRTADGLGIDFVYLTGYTPYPIAKNDQRLPHLAQRNHNKIAKTALGAENNSKWSYFTDINELLTELKSKGYILGALEQNSKSVELNKFITDKNIAIILGSEVLGIDKDLIEQCDVILEIPMSGTKESFNVIEAATMAMYQLKFHNK